MSVEISKIKNGWLVKDGYNEAEAFLNLQTLFTHLLLVLDGRANTFGGDSYGNVIVKLKPEEQ